MYILMRKVGSSPDYNLCYKFYEYATAQAKYQELLKEVAPSKLLLISTTEARLNMVVHGDGTVSVSPAGEYPVATETQMGIIRLATALQANWDDPQNYVDGMPVSVPPTLIKAMIEAGLADISVSDATTIKKGVVRLATEEEADYDDPSNGDDHIAVMQPISTKDMINVAAEYTTEYSHSTVTNIKEALNDIYEQLNYVPLEITTFQASSTMYEIGATPTVTCTWSYNKNMDIVWQKLDNIDIVANLRSYALQGITSTKDIILSASDGTDMVSKSLRVTFTNRIYWGAATMPASFDSLWVKNLSSNRLSTTYKGTYSFNTGSDKCAFIAMPASYNPPSEAYINSWLTELLDCGNIEFTSDTGIISQYKILRTTNSGLGGFDIVF